MKSIDVSRLWEGIPARYILGVLGDRRVDSMDELWEIREITLGGKIEFHMIHLEKGEETEIAYTPIPHFTENIREYFGNPRNLLIFTHRILDRVVQYKNVMRDIQSQYFERGRKRKYLLQYMESYPLQAVRGLIPQIISCLNANPVLIMWVLEGIRENFPLNRKTIQFKTSDGETRVLCEDPQISEFPTIFAHGILPYYSLKFDTIPIYFDKSKEETIIDADVRYRIFHRMPVHSLFLQSASISSIFRGIASQILRFIDKFLFVGFENILEMTLEDAYLSSWEIGQKTHSVLYFTNLAEDMIIQSLMKERGNVIAHGIEGSKYLNTITIKEYLKSYYEKLNS
ncbi:MAG: hypothetical protein QIT36_gp049 [Methanophagales virus GBV301]|uniref:Uncharacterized protein n=1 Tax=Methanophagales virus GBV301 TaxID=2999280 RepID=A0A9E9A5Q4_9CAUD|nr:MAG: hypothetical protein QIT36_gp049 [Methanophagales virus GBV301]WAE39473.1 MAG: hypothetical protein LDLAKGPJ_00049 [Methanophagales virus GBV301]